MIVTPPGGAEASFTQAESWFADQEMSTVLVEIIKRLLISSFHLFHHQATP